MMDDIHYESLFRENRIYLRFSHFYIAFKKKNVMFPKSINDFILLIVLI